PGVVPVEGLRHGARVRPPEVHVADRPAPLRGGLELARHAELEALVLVRAPVVPARLPPGAVRGALVTAFADAGLDADAAVALGAGRQGHRHEYAEGKCGDGTQQRAHQCTVAFARSSASRDARSRAKKSARCSAVARPARANAA